MKNKSVKFSINLCLLILTFTNCSIKGSFQGLYSYYDKTNSKAPNLIQKPTIPVCNLFQQDTPVVFAVNGIEMRNCLENIEKSLVYVWKPKCSSDVCISPKDLQRFCETKNIELFIVAEYYDFERMALCFPTKRPIFGVDCQYYASHLTKNYLSLFLSDVMDEKTRYQEQQFYLFSYGCLLDISNIVKAEWF